MKYYPVNLDIRNRNCLVVGGGAVGTRKVKTLVECGATVTVVSPQASAKLELMAAEGAITLKNRNYRTTDLEGTCGRRGPQHPVQHCGSAGDM